LLSWLDRKQWEEERPAEAALQVDLKRVHFSRETKKKAGEEKAKIIFSSEKEFDPKTWFGFLTYLLGQTVLNLQRNCTLKTNIKEIKSFISKMSRLDILLFHIASGSLGCREK